jgi:hypothetical protein
MPFSSLLLRTAGSESPLLRSMTDPTPTTRLDGATADTKDGGDGA